MKFMKQFSYVLLATILFACNALAQDATPTATPDTKKVTDVQTVKPEELKGVPPIEPKYQSDDKKLPDLGRVGVDMLEQKVLTLNDAIKMALENNKDIEVSRQNIKSAEFDLQAADGFYQPRLSGTSYFERAKVPSISIFNPTQTANVNNSIAGNITYSGLLKKYGSSYSATLSNQRITTDNVLSPLNPQFTTSFNFTFTQPIMRGRKIDNQRRTIEIAKRNLTLTDTQFRQRSIETIATVQRAYWDLTFALRNLQVQRDGVRDAKEQLVHNERLVNEGQLAPIDIVAAKTQVANLELAVYDALDGVNRAENVLKNLIVADKNDSLWNVSLVPNDKLDLDAPRTTPSRSVGCGNAESTGT